MVVKDAIFKGTVAASALAFAFASALAFAFTLAFAFAFTLAAASTVLGEVAQVPLCGLVAREVREGTDTRHAAALGQIRQVAVDRQVHRDVVPLALLGSQVAERREASTRDVLKDDVIEFVLEHVPLLLVGEPLEKRRVVDKLQLALLGHADPGSRDARCAPLVHSPGQCRKEGLVQQESVHVNVQVESTHGRILRV